MNNFRIIPFEKGEKAIFYTIQYDGELLSETDKFFTTYEASHTKDIDMILQSVSRMLNKRGTQYEDFRPEGKNYIVALPRGTYELRLYGIWINGQITILGNGGIKNTRTFQEDETLSKIVKELSEINKLLAERIENNDITVENDELIGDLYFILNDNEYE